MSDLHRPNLPWQALLPGDEAVRLRSLYFSAIASMVKVDGQLAISERIFKRFAELEGKRQAVAGNNPTLNRAYDVVVANFLANALNIQNTTYER